MLDLIIKGGFIITMDTKNKVIKNGSIGINKDKIVKVGTVEEFKGIESKRAINANNKIIMPGLIDVHGHAGHGLTKGIGTNIKGGSWQRLMEYIYFENSTEEFWRAEALLSGSERIKFGTTCGYSMLGAAPRCDDPIYGERHIEAMKETGMRNILGIGPARTSWPRRFVRWNRNTSKNLFITLDDSIKTTEYLLKKWHGKDDLSFVHVSPSSIDPGMGDTIEGVQHMFEKLIRLTKEYNTMLNTHAYKSHIKFADKFLKGVLGSNTLLAHVTGVDPEEIKLLADTGTNVTSSPSSHAYMLSRCPVTEMIKAGVNVAFSTDGSAPDRTFDLFKELRIAMIEHRSHFNDVTYLPPGKVLKMVTIDAAKAIGLESIIGSLVPGKKADIILVDLHSPHLTPKMVEPIRMIYAATGHDVHTVIIDGKIIMEDRKLLTVDEDKVISFAQIEAEKMIERANITNLPSPYDFDDFWEGSKFTQMELEEYIDLPDSTTKIYNQ